MFLTDVKNAKKYVAADAYEHATIAKMNDAILYSHV